MEIILKHSNIPNIGGKKIYSNNLCSELTITNIIFDYVRNEVELFIKNLKIILLIRKKLD